MTNLLEETLQKLKSNGKSKKDVLWCGSSEFGYFSFNHFIKVANFEYDDGYGSPKVAEDLVIVGKDFWLERHEYDGSEDWRYKKIPKKPEKMRKPLMLHTDGLGWNTLTELNR